MFSVCFRCRLGSHAVPARHGRNRFSLRIGFSLKFGHSYKKRITVALWKLLLIKVAQESESRRTLGFKIASCPRTKTANADCGLEKVIGREPKESGEFRIKCSWGFTMTRLCNLLHGTVGGGTFDSRTASSAGKRYAVTHDDPDRGKASREPCPNIEGAAISPNDPKPA